MLAVAPMPRVSSKNCNGGKAGRLAEHADGEAQILQASFHKRFPACRADDFLRNFETATLQAHGANGFPTAHALLHLFFGCHLLVGAELLIQLPVHLLLSEQ